MEWTVQGNSPGFTGETGENEERILKKFASSMN